MLPKTLFYGETATPRFAPIWVAVTDRGVWAASYGISAAEFKAEAARRGSVQCVYDPQKVRSVLKQMEQYLAGKRTRFEVKVDWRGMTDFQVVVRKAVMAVPYGKTASYGEIAAAVGKPQAPRAVGGVQASNPISFIIPCHRIIAADGSLGGYGGPAGLKIKRWLLDMEAGKSR
ncbi:MAG: methylated-DNA--[protein]-cysteine S-methyltransferase [Anaerolineales bacterium]